MRDGRIAAVGGTDDIRALAGPGDPRHRSGRPHRHPRPDRFPHPRHPRRPDLHHRGALDRRAHARRGARPPSRHGRDARPKGSWLVVAGGWTERQFAEDRRPTQAEIAAAAPDHHVYVQQLYSRVLLDPGGADALGIARDAGTRRAPHHRARRRRPADRLAHRRQPHHQRSVQSAAAPDVRAEGRGHARVLPRAQCASASPACSIPAATTCRSPTTSRCSQVWRERGADLARALQPVRAAPRPRARGFQGADPGAADGLRRRVAALQRHRRERHLGHVQQRRRRPMRRRSSLPTCCAGRSRAA